jgi:glycosyltransferase involved in cell wall biosynthesis
VRGLRTRGLEVDVLASSTAGLYGERLRAEGVSVIDLGQRTGFDAVAARRARAILARYDVIHFHSADPLLAREAARLGRSRLFYTHRAGRFVYSPRRALKYEVFGRYLRRSFSVAANTQQAACTASSLFRIPLEDIQVVYNGLDFSLLKPTRSREAVREELGVPESSVLIGTSGNIRDWKRIDRLLDAMAALPAMPVHCVIVGDGPERPALERLRDRLGLRSRVTFVGRKEHIGDFLQVLDVFALPSGPEESFGNAAVEAMGVGLPTIVFADGGGLTEHIVDGKTGFMVRDQTDFLRRLAEVALDRDLRCVIGAAGRESVRRKYSLNALVDRHVELYRRPVREREGKRSRREDGSQWLALSR